MKLIFVLLNAFLMVTTMAKEVTIREYSGHGCQGEPRSTRTYDITYVIFYSHFIRSLSRYHTYLRNDRITGWDAPPEISSPLFKVPAISTRSNYRMNFSSQLQSALNNVIVICVTPKRRCIPDIAKISRQRSWEWNSIPRSTRLSIATVRAGSSTP